MIPRGRASVAGLIAPVAAARESFTSIKAVHFVRAPFASNLVAMTAPQSLRAAFGRDLDGAARVRVPDRRIDVRGRPGTP
jgi:hypothetical protein